MRQLYFFYPTKLQYYLLEYLTLIFQLNQNLLTPMLKVFYKNELVDEYNLFAFEDVKKLNIFSRLMKSINFLIWGDV